MKKTRLDLLALRMPEKAEKVRQHLKNLKKEREAKENKDNPQPSMSMTKAELIAVAEKMEIEFSPDWTKQEILDAIEG